MQITISDVTPRTMRDTISYSVSALQVLRIGNPSITNADRSQEFIAIVIVFDDVLAYLRLTSSLLKGLSKIVAMRVLSITF